MRTQGLGTLVIGVVLLVACSVGWISAPGLRKALVLDRAAECVAHADGGAAGFSEQKLDQALRRFRRNLYVLAGAGAAACLLVSLQRALRRAPAMPLATPLLAAALVAAFETGSQLDLTLRAFRLGVFGESKAAREQRFFDRAVLAAQRIRSVVPADSAFVVTRFDDPQDVKKVGYLVFPRRLFMLPDASIRASATELRSLIAAHPESFTWAAERGYRYAIDLKALIVDDDISAIVPLVRQP